MDLETENRIAALLMQESTRLRLQAEKEGVHVYLRKPNVRYRPNSRFLTATVMGVQQANRAVEVDEMWRVRQKELELDERQTRRLKDADRVENDRHLVASSEQSSSHEVVDRNTANCLPCKHGSEGFSLQEDGSLQDDEVEEFLLSRKKRGRGSVGSRMDEPGPYLMPTTSLDLSEKLNSDTRIGEEWEKRILLGPEKPSFLKSDDVRIERFLAHDKRKDADFVESSKDRNSKDRHRSKKDKTRNKEKKDKKSKKKDKNSKKRHG